MMCIMFIYKKEFLSSLLMYFIKYIILIKIFNLNHICLAKIIYIFFFYHKS